MFGNGTAIARIEDLDNLETMPIPVGHHNSKDDNFFYWMPRVGQRVAVLMDENAEQGVILCGIYTESDPPPITNLDQFYLKIGGIEIVGDRITGVLQVDCTRVEITCSTETTINTIPVVCVGAPDNDDESSGSDRITASNQFGDA
ncbi:hypothetical protein [Thermoleptolyngbya sp. M55_K2018_002]|uniref:hypothetical protein n=1 Tax=Thermoleptolyngbya sp. M55_K2018_002 TaxID=2747808 RepID=UPI001A04B378|nr:hypothetical protein [Thermoleptolyngbya sp. M55_K2018_002]HIK42150.1 hypothetical protein [Thermoleptolyngbya sp. M55_K2018_002]